jgi:purine-binding chemotaxis protein CheW
MTDHKNVSETYILFEIAGTTYAVASQSVQQVEMITHITPLPNAPPFVEGVVFTRGQVVPAINLRTRFGFERAPLTTRTRLIVTNFNGRVVGLIVDSAREFMSIAAEAIQPPPQSMASVSGRYLKGIVTMGERIVLLVSIDQILDVAAESVSAVEGGS